MARSPLFGKLRRWLNDGRPVKRRTFLKAAAAASLVYAPMLKGAMAPRVAIVGAGVAGLRAAWELKKQGIRAQVYESSKRTGGRMFTATGLVADGITTELGGEFIDTGHREMLGLASTFGLELLDMFEREEARLKREAYLFGGALRSEEEILRAFREVAPQIRRDIQLGARRWDRVSIEQYLSEAKISGWLRGIIEVALRTEYGLDIGNQSAMNLLALIVPDTANGRIQWFGESDERYKIRGGNQRVVDALADEVKEQIMLERRLEAVKPMAGGGGGYQLSFQKGSSGAVEEVTADVVLLTVPFTILRQVDVRVPLPAAKKRAITELGYGTNAKLMMGVKRRIWREQGYGGNLFSDEVFQLAWDSSRRQAGTAGGLTSLGGGKGGVEYGVGTPEEQRDRLLPGLSRAWRGIGEELNGRVARFHWPGHPHSLGSYACYQPGQWTGIRGKEYGAVGRLHFAGEHTSVEAQGYMEGGAETGKRAAAAIGKQVR